MSGRPSRRSGRDREALMEVREGSGGPCGSPGEVRRPSRKSARALEAFLKAREAISEV